MEGMEDYDCSPRIDLNRHLIRNLEATYYLRVYRDTKLCGVSIHPGDLLIVDRAAIAADGDLVVVEFDDELTVRRLEAGAEGQLFGKVLHVIHSLEAAAIVPGAESDEWPEFIDELGGTR